MKVIKNLSLEKHPTTATTDKRVGVIQHDVEDCLRLVRVLNRLALHRTSDYLNQLQQVRQLLATQFVVDGEAFDEVVLQNAVCPLAELYASLGFDAVSNRDNNIQIINSGFHFLSKTSSRTIFLG